MYLYKELSVHLIRIMYILFYRSREDRERYRAGLVPTINMATLAIIENLFIVLGFLFNSRFTGDYRYYSIT